MRVVGGELAVSAGAVGSVEGASGSGGSWGGSIGDLEAMVEWLTRLSCGSADIGVSDAVRIDRIAVLERVQAAAFAAQAAQMARFADSQEAGQRRAGVPARRVGVGVAEQVALACRVSPVTGARRVSLARALVGQLPHTYGLLARGDISAWVATIVAHETDALTAQGRAVVDARLAATVASMSPRQVEAATRRAAISVDPASAVRRGRTARTDRRVSIRPAPDTMALVSGFVPVEQGVAAWASLDRAARTRRANGDPRSLSQLRADTFIERLTGQATATAVPVEIGLTIALDALLGTDTCCGGAGRGEDPIDGSRAAGSTVATLPGYGPIPADFARDLAGMRGDPDEMGDAAGEAAAGSRVRPTDVGDAGVGNGGAHRARVFIRRILTDPIDHTVVAVDTRRRRFDGPLARYLIARDQHCRIPYCTAPIRHLDHIQPWRDDGPTTATNGQGLCERHSYTKEAPGWQVTVIDPDPDPGRSRHTTIITTPTGHTYQSQAPPASS
jgi:hypothetical protein